MYHRVSETGAVRDTPVRRKADTTQRRSLQIVGGRGMKPLIDGDILRYELASCGEYEEQDEHTGEPIKRIRDFEFVRELVDERIRGICLDVEADEPPTLYFTGCRLSTRLLNRNASLEGRAPITLHQSVRELVATVKPYKGTRHAEKPFHFANITAYLFANYDCCVSNGLEADDHMALDQCRRPLDTVICTRDKDLRMVPGWHFGWECGAQPSFGPELVDKRGWLRQDAGGKIRGVGLNFFFFQMLTGDTVDNIPGCPKVGPVKAMKVLTLCEGRAEHEEAIKQLYYEAYPDNWKEMLLEQSKLLWMVQELDENGNAIDYDWRF
jgi:hypothetical protein